MVAFNMYKQSVKTIKNDQRTHMQTQQITENIHFVFAVAAN